MHCRNSGTTSHRSTAGRPCTPRSPHTVARSRPHAAHRSAMPPDTRSLRNAPPEAPDPTHTDEDAARMGRPPADESYNRSCSRGAMTESPPTQRDSRSCSPVCTDSHSNTPHAATNRSAETLGNPYRRCMLYSLPRKDPEATRPPWRSHRSARPPTPLLPPQSPTRPRLPNRHCLRPRAAAAPHTGSIRWPTHRTPQARRPSSLVCRTRALVANASSNLGEQAVDFLSLLRRQSARDRPKKLRLVPSMLDEVGVEARKERDDRVQLRLERLQVALRRPI
ncbi:MAG: hypothetical protein ACI81R_001115 [Bradymonadia bacterium]|jgi:hypothetical protein